MSRNIRRFYIIISVLSLLNVIFLPIYTEGGPMISKTSEYSFVRIIGDLFMEEGTLSLWVTQMTLCIFVPSVIMLATAFTRMRSLYILCDLCGVGLWIFNFARYGIENGFKTLFDVNKTDISIGAWVAILLLLINSLVILCAGKNKKEEPEDEEKEEDEFCPHCGRALRGNTSFCPRCGKKLDN